MNQISAERISLALQSRGYPYGNVEAYKKLLRRLSPSDHQTLKHRLHHFVLGSVEAECIHFLTGLTQLAQGVECITTDPILLKLRDYCQMDYSRERRNYPGNVQQGMTPSPASVRTAKESDVSRKKHYVYGQRCAYMFELDWLRAKPSDPKQKRTVTVEAAHQIAHRSYDWEGRISFQLTLLELPQFTAVLLGKLHPEQVWEVGNHGRLRDKFFRAKEQNSSVYLKLQQGASIWPVRVGQEHRYQILTLALEALSYNDEHLDLPTITQLCSAALPRFTGKN